MDLVLFGKCYRFLTYAGKRHINYIRISVRVRAELQGYCGRSELKVRPANITSTAQMTTQ